MYYRALAMLMVAAGCSGPVSQPTTDPGGGQPTLRPRTVPPIRSLAGARGPVSAVAFSEDGSAIAAASHARGAASEVCVWDVWKQRLALTLPGGNSECVSLAFSPDGQWLAAGAMRQISIWDARSGELRHTLQGFEGPAEALVFWRDGQKLASINSWFEKCEIRCWDPRTGAPLATLSVADQSDLSAMDLSADGTTLITAGSLQGRLGAGQIAVWDVASGAVRQRIESAGVVSRLSLSPNGQTIAAASGLRITLWDAATGQLIRTIDEAVSNLAFAPSGQTLLGILQTSRDLGDFSARNYTYQVNQDLPNGSIVKLIDIHSGRVTRTFVAAHEGLGRSAVSSDGAYLAIGGDDPGQVRVWITGPSD